MLIPLSLFHLQEQNELSKKRVHEYQKSLSEQYTMQQKSICSQRASL